MRKLRFRIWDKGRSEWVHDTKHAVNLFGEYIIMGEILRRPDDSIVSLEELNNLEAMQFTGLRDKNGVEIFEGDIIRGSSMTMWSEKNPCVYEVKWEMVGAGDYPVNFVGYELPIRDIEVIGNIYETPHLLSEAK